MCKFIGFNLRDIIVSTCCLLLFFSTLQSCQQTDTVSASDPNWHENSFYLYHLDHHTRKDQHVGRDADFDETLRILKISRPDVIQTHAKGRPGFTTYPSKVGNVPDSLQKDVLQVWKDLSIELNVPFSIYYNLGRDAYLMEHRPEFNRHRLDGSLFPERLCYNSGVDTAYLLPMIKEIMEWYQPQGMWFDGYVFTINACFCEKCKSDFQKVHDRKAPESPMNPDWEIYKEMQREYARNLIKKTCDLIHSIDPECLVSVNFAYSLRMPEKPYHGIAYLEGDISGDTRDLAVLSKFYDTQGKPFNLMTPIFKDTRRGRQPKDADHQQQEIAVIIANGGRFFAWDFPTRGSGLVEERQLFLGKIAEWMRERKEFTLHTERVPDISILNIAAAHYHNHQESNHCFLKENTEVYAASETLVREHLLHDIVADWKLKEGTVKGKTIILENPSLIPNDVSIALARFVEEGGRLFITGNVPGDNNLNMLLAGIQDISAPVDSELTIENEKIHLSYRPVALTPDAKVLVKAKLSGFVSDIPLLIKTLYGKGEVFYTSFPFYTERYEGDLPDNLFHLIQEHVFPDESLRLTTNASPDVELVLREKEKMKIIHCINRSIGDESGFYTSYVNTDFPRAEGFSLSLKSQSRPVSITAEPGNKPLNWTYEQGEVIMDVPGFHVHQMIVVKEY